MLFKGEIVSLEEILQAKEERVACYQELLKEHPGTIVSYKLNIPGPIKANDLINRIFDAGLNSWFYHLEKNSISPLNPKFVYQKTGPEYYTVLKNDPLSIKELTTSIEESHSLGRLFDFDVSDSGLNPYNRQQKRKCLICERDAFTCGRTKAHDLTTLQNKIIEMVEAYCSGKGCVLKLNR